MASQTGHDMNLANIRELITECTYLGEEYDPSDPDLTLTAVNAYTADCQSAQNDVRNSVPVLKGKMGDRAAGFKETMPMLARIVAAHATSPNESLKAEVKGLVRKMRGQRAKPIPKTPDGELTEEQTSAVNVGYENRAADFASIVATVTSDAGYKTKTTDLTKPKLAERLTMLNDLNAGVRNAQAPVNVARTTWNTLFYTGEKNLVERGQLMKLEVKSTFGARSEQYKRVSTIKFTRPTKRR